MFEGGDGVILDLLYGEGRVDPARLAAARARSADTGRSLADELLAAGTIARAELIEAVARRLGLRSVKEVPVCLPATNSVRMDAVTARTYGLAVRGESDGVLELLVANPFELPSTRELELLAGGPVGLILADPDAMAAMARPENREEKNRAIDPTREAAETRGDEAPVIRFVNEVLAGAIRDRASDVHFEPFENEFRIRRRIDGTLRELRPAPPVHPAPVISRLKVLAGLDIAECRRPQDGRIKLTVDRRAVDLRISTLPTQDGESVVLRVLDQSVGRLGLEAIGLPAGIESALRRVIALPHGLVLVTGPTGSGKTSTLYACLDAINSSAVKILTIEDPVEYEVDGPVQVSINPAAGLTFARALRSFLRQDPDVILVGEIRDAETAHIAIQAALSGHLVLSTLHTNDAAGAVERLVDLGVEPFLIASTVQAVLAQRLMRRVCVRCRRLVRVEDAAARLLAGDAAGVLGRELPLAPGCAECAHTGYRGRMALFEWFELSEAARELVSGRAPPGELRRCARAGGAVALREVALQAAVEGHTSLEEILKYT